MKIRRKRDFSGFWIGLLIFLSFAIAGTMDREAEREAARVEVSR